MADSPSGTEIARLVVDHHAEVYRYAFRLSGSVVDAEDLTQQTFLAAQLHLAQLRSAEKARSWLFTILRNCYLKSRRRLGPLPAANLELDVNEIPANAVVDSIDREQLQTAINGLPDDYKLVVLMFYFEDCSYRDIAVRLGIPLGTVMSRLSRAKGELRGRLFAGEGKGADRHAPAPLRPHVRPRSPAGHIISSEADHG